MGRAMAWLNAPAQCVRDPKIVLRGAVTLLGGAFEPDERFVVVLLNAESFPKHVRTVELRVRMSVLGCAGEPLVRLDDILFGPPALEVAQAERVLPVGVLLVGGARIPFRSCCVVLFDAPGQRVRISQSVLRRSIATRSVTSARWSSSLPTFPSTNGPRRSARSA